MTAVCEREKIAAILSQGGAGGKQNPLFCLFGAKEGRIQPVGEGRFYPISTRARPMTSGMVTTEASVNTDTTEEASSVS